MRAWLLWPAALSLLDFWLMGLDKGRAKGGGRRVRERTFFLIALLGGSPGAILGMYLFHHKTRHWYFKYGLPGMLLLQIAASIFLIHLYKTGALHFIQMYA